MRSSASGWPLALAAATAAAYANTFRAPFVLDDGAAITNNPSIKPGASLLQLLRADNTTVAGRPLLNLSFAANWAWSGAAPWSYHCVNLAIHLAAGLVLFGLLRRALATPRLAARFGADATALAAAISAVWLLHPLQTGAVTYVTERAESLMGLFYLLTLYGFVRACAGNGGVPAALAGERRWYAVSALACLFGMATKEVMATAPLLVLGLDRSLFSGSFAGALRARSRYYACLAATWILLAFLVVDSRLFSRGAGTHTGIGPLQYAATESKVVVKYATLAFWPHPLVFDYGPEYYLSRISQAWPYALAIAAALGVTVWAWRRSKPAGFLLAAFFVLLSPTSTFIPLGLDPMSENRMYLPLAAVVTLVGTGLHAWLGRRAVGLLLLIALACGIATFERNQTYRTDLGLWQDTLAKVPDNSRGWIHLGTAWSRLPHGREQALASYAAALRIKPNSIEALIDLADLEAKAPDGLREAEAHFRAALRQDPNSYDARIGLADVLARMGRYDESIPEYAAALRLNPGSAVAHNNYAIALGHLPDRTEQALAEFAASLRCDPDYAEAYNNRANLWLRLGRAEPAVADYEHALALRPDSPKIDFNLAVALLRTDRTGEAASRLEQALKLDPNFDRARQLLQQLAAPAGR